MFMAALLQGQYKPDSSVPTGLLPPESQKDIPFFGIRVHIVVMIVIGTDVVERYLRSRSGHQGIKAARTQYDAWLAITRAAQWRIPEDVKASYPKASILKGSRAVVNIKGNDYRLIAAVQYQGGVLAIRFFGTHPEYDKVGAETV
jgi:mRNA interferase HigB